MPTVVRKGDLLFAKYRDQFDIPKHVDISGFQVLGAQARPFLKPLLRYIDRLNPRSFVNYLKVTATLGKSLQRGRVRRLPKTEAGWQSLVVQVHRDVITDPISRASLESRADVLGAINTLLNHLQSEDLIPLGVCIPDTAKRLNQIRATPHDSPLLGTAKASSTRSARLLCDISLSRSDADYLDEVRDELARRRSVLRAALISYWDALRTHVEWGVRSAAAVDQAGLLKSLEKASPGVNQHKPSMVRTLLDPRADQGLANLLCVLQAKYRGLPRLQEMDRRWIPAVLEDGDFDMAVPPGVVLPFPPGHRSVSGLGFARTRMRWMLGRITRADVGVLSALLIMDQPRFTPEAVTHARIRTRRDKLILNMGDAGATFSVHKNRAHSMKGQVLSDTSLSIVRFVSELGRPHRARLRDQRSPLADLLFITHDDYGRSIIPPHHTITSKFLSGASRSRPNSRWLGDFVPGLAEGGLGRTTISLSKIRATEGVLEWFRSGSLKAVSRRLGNKTKTVLTHYIHPALLVAWNTRLVRRFQNLWIAVATAKEDFLLTVTDFNSLTELNRFLADMLSQHSASSSQLAAELHRRFGNLPDHEEPSGEEGLCIAISKQSLAALYVYQHVAIEAGLTEQVLDRADPKAGVSPRQFLDLATLLRHQLPDHSNPRYRQAHSEAIALVSTIGNKVQWAHLFAREEPALHG